MTVNLVSTVSSDAARHPETPEPESSVMATLQSAEPAARHGRPAQIALAWGVMFAIMLPPIIWPAGRRALTMIGGVYLLTSGILVLCALTLTFFWPAVRALRGYLLAYLAILAGPVAILLITRHAAYTDWVRTLPVGLQILLTHQFGPVVFRLITVLLVAVTLIGSGLTRRDLFLVPGDLSARFQPNLILPRSPQWWLLAAVGLVFSGAAHLFHGAGHPRQPHVVAARADQSPIHPARSSNQCVRRGVHLALGADCSVKACAGPGAVQLAPGNDLRAVALLRDTFGPVGVLMAGFWGWAAGKSMLDSRGFTFNYILHFGMDAIIFAFFVMAVA